MFEGGSNANKQLLHCIYYWDEPDDPSGSGWWIGTEVGGSQVWAYSASAWLLDMQDGRGVRGK